jgi:hypothetical protein
MYKVEPKFENVLETQKFFLKQQIGKVSQESFFAGSGIEDIKSMVEKAAWDAWRAQQAQSVDGHAPYAFGTYFTYHLMNAKKEYWDIKPSIHKELINTAGRPSGNIFYKEDMKFELDPVERKIFDLRFDEEKTLSECAKEVGYSIETCRIIANRIKDKICKTYVQES